MMPFSFALNTLLTTFYQTWWDLLLLKFLRFNNTKPLVRVFKCTVDHPRFLRNIIAFCEYFENNFLET